MTDTFRRESTELSEDVKTLVDFVKFKGEVLESFYKTKPSREMSLALTKLEESVMWAVKALTKPPEA